MSNDKHFAKNKNSIIPTHVIKSLLSQDMFDEVVLYTSRQNSLSLIDAEHLLIECLKYLYLTSAFPDKLGGLFLPVVQHVDDVWHYLILQTREYRSLCEKRLPGHYFIEHRAMPYEKYGRDREPEREKMIEESLRWLALYQKTFGGFARESARHWTMVRYLHEQLGMSLDDINALESQHS